MGAGLLAHDILGSQRSLVDYLTLLEGPDKPFLAMARKGPKVDNAYYEWPVDTYEAAEDNAVVDGEDVKSFSNADEDYAVLSNRIQWIRDSAMVSKLSQEVQNQAGVPNKKAWAIKKKLERVWRNIEATLCSDNDVQTGSSTKPNKLRGIGKWIDSSLTDVDTKYRTTSDSIKTGAISGHTESVVQGMLQELWNGCGKVKTYQCLCGGNIKRSFTDFTNTQKGTTNVMGVMRTYQNDGKSKTIVNSIDRYEGDFGVLELVPTQYNLKFNGGAYSHLTGYVLDFSKIDLVWFQGPQVQPLDDQGGGPRFAVDAIVGLRVFMPKEQGAFKYTS